MRALRVSAKASYSAISGSASGRASMVRSTKLDRSVRTIVASVEIVNNGTTLNPTTLDSSVGPRLELTPAALALIKIKGMQEFRKTCGDAYVAAVHNGARLDALFFQSRSEEEYKNFIKASASGQYGGFSGSANLRSSLIKDKEKMNFVLNKHISEGLRRCQKQPIKC
jgi:hypothetical protein